MESQDQTVVKEFYIIVESGYLLVFVDLGESHFGWGSARERGFTFCLSALLSALLQLSLLYSVDNSTTSTVQKESLMSELKSALFSSSEMELVRTSTHRKNEPVRTVRILSALSPNEWDKSTLTKVGIRDFVGPFFYDKVAPNPALASSTSAAFQHSATLTHFSFEVVFSEPNKFP